MHESLPNAPDVKLLPDATGSPPDDARLGPASADGPVVAGISPQRQLSELPRDELQHLAEEFGLDPTRHPDLKELVVAIHDRRQMISGLDRDAMLDVVRW